MACRCAAGRNVRKTGLPDGGWSEPSNTVRVEEVRPCFSSRRKKTLRPPASSV
jgi:hypothetical protein